MSPAANTPRKRGPHHRVGFDVARRVERHHVAQEGGVRFETDIHEYACDRLRVHGTGREMAPTNRRNGVLAEDFLDHRLRDDLDLAAGARLVQQRALGIEAVRAMQDRDARGVRGKHQRLVERGIAAADDAHLLSREERPVARGTVRHALAEQFLGAGDGQPTQSRAGGDDDGGSPQALARSSHDAMVAVRLEPFDAVDEERGAGRFRLFVQQRAELVAADPLGKPGKVLDPFGIGDLAAGAELFDHHDLEPVTAGEGCGRQPGDTGPDDDEFEVSHALFDLRGVAPFRICPPTIDSVFVFVPSPACGGGSGRGQFHGTELAARAPSPTLPRKREREQKSRSIRRIEAVIRGRNLTPRP